MRNGRRIIAFSLVVILVAGFPMSAFACWLCKYSPNYWGFCRSGFSRGHGDCTEFVEDPWSGRTDCRIMDWGTCGAGLGDGGECIEDCEEYQWASLPCSWTDRAAMTLV